MGKLQERENKRKSIIGGMIDAPVAPVASTGSRGRPKEDRELKKRISLSVLPSLYDDIQKIAYVQRRSVSELLSAMMEEYSLLGVVKRLAVAKKGIYDGLAVVEQAPNSEIAAEYKAVAEMIISGKMKREEQCHG